VGKGNYKPADNEIVSPPVLALNEIVIDVALFAVTDAVITGVDDAACAVTGT
jgi:hypothetical protein